MTDNDSDTSCSNEGGSSEVIDNSKKEISGDEKATLGEQPAADKRKTTFSVGGASVRDTIKKHEALVMKCEFSNGRCMTHSVKSKKYSVVGITDIEWRNRDVTCLVQ